MLLERNNECEKQASLVLTWKNVSGWIDVNRKSGDTKRLLHNVSGVAKAGLITAVLSPSGAGKTILLAALSRRFKGTLTGEILLNGCSIDQEQMSNISGFVCQKDPMFENLTVWEHLSFAARLKMDAKLSNSHRQKHVLRIVENLVLSHRLHVKISSLSGGQRKRLSLATQLLMEPKVLFCDEPTTGLDSFSAITVVKLLRTLADEGKMIICTIHQPASGIFELFDQVALLASEGKLAYHGPVSEVKDYFSRLGMDCPENYNLSDYVVSQISIRSSSVEEYSQDEIRVQKLVSKFQESKVYHQLNDELDISRCDKNFVDTSRRIARVSFITEFRWLLWRAAVQIKRSYKLWLLRFFLYLFAFSCLAFPYGKIRINQIGVQNLQGFIHSVLMEVLYSSLYAVTNSIPDELPIFIQESADKVYSPHSYYFSKLIVLSTKAIIECYIYTSYAFTITGLNKTIEDYILTGIPVILIALASSAYGFFLSTAFESVTTFSLFSVPFEIICQAYGGIIIKLTSLPPITAWLKYLSILFYAYEALDINQWTKYAYIPCEKGNRQTCKYKSGKEVLSSFGFSPADLPLDYIGLVVYFTVLHSLALFFLLRKLKRYTTY